MADGQTAHAHHAFPGPAGDHVGGAELARLFVLAGAAPQAMHELVRGASRWHQIDSEVAASRLTAAPDWLRLDLQGWPDIGAQLAAHSDLTGFRQGLADAWQRVMAAPGPCGLIQNAPAGLDWAALSTALCRDAPLQALAFDHHRPDVAALDWPMRVALPATADGRALRERLMAPGWMPPLVQTVGLRSRQPVDAFVWPGTVSQALVALRRSAGRRASVVLVMGGIGRLAAPVSEALHELSQLCAAAIVAVHQPDDAVTPWALPSLVAELSHNTPWPLAIHRALRTPDTAPLVLADLRFALENRPLDAALRLAEVLRDQPGEAALAQRIETTAARWPWSRETDGATELAHLRRDIERRIGPVDLRRRPWSREAMAMAGPPDLAEAGADGDGAAPVEPEPSDPARHVKFNLLPLDPSAPLPDEPVLRPQADHRLQVFIAEFATGAHATATTPLDESWLDDREEGHELSIVYCPLSPVERGGAPPAVMPPTATRLHLPRRGPTQRITFLLRCGGRPADFRARLIVLHANRVLQTLLLNTADGDRLAMAVENRYAPGFASPSADVPADLSFVINESPQGSHGLATIDKGGVSFIDPPGLSRSIDFMRDAMGAAFREEVVSRAQAIDRPETLGLMRTLANHGASILDRLSRQHPVQALEAARRIQVVEAVDKAFFPAEFLYSGKAPLPTAALCPNARDALRAGSTEVHDHCPHRQDKNHVCPMAFWGFHKCIERHTASGDTAHVVSVPTPGEERLGPFGSVLLGASQIASKEMTGARGLPQAIRHLGLPFAHVTSWDDWQQQVRERAPDLLLLMPHSTESPDFEGIPALEISSAVVASSNLDEGFVHVGGGKGPLVLLLGCSTSLTEVSFLDFVRQFHAAGAPVVIGTLSIIHASQAGLVVRRLLEATTDPARGALRLDEAMLAVRRALLADGHGSAFTLMAYGHSAWRL